MEFFNDLYPGNLSVTESLISAIANEGVVAFTGAGTSMPELPSWHALVQILIQDSFQAGLIDESTVNALRAEESDFLYVIDEVYKCAGETQTKIKVSEIFKSLKANNASHEAIVASNFSKIITINYDTGLEKAYASLFSSHLANITTRNEHEVHEWIGSSSVGALPAILHWHGLANDANSIILSGSDYVSFYETNLNNKNTLRSLFARERCALIGFGFEDPFIVSQLNSVMQPLPTANKHFAIIGVPDNQKFNCQLERRKYISKYKLEAIFYPITTGSSENRHSALQVILKALREKCPRPAAASVQNESVIPVKPVNLDDGYSYRSSLFEIGGRKIYCEPNLRMQGTETDGSNIEESKITVSDIISGSYNCFISAPHEFGLTNLGRRLASELALSDTPVVHRDAAKIPNYKKKILQDAEFSKAQSAESSTVIIDNFSSIDHQRLLKELISALPKARIIVLQRASLGNEITEENLSSSNFRLLTLHGLTRSDIRNIIFALSPAWNSDITSTVVDKVYNDLLQLCIPLTPSNVIMYASVLCKDGSFIPVSRLHIVDRFVLEALQRPSDAYSESFNYLNKVDVFSEFCHQLFSKDEWSFDLASWNSFCAQYKKNNLVDFDQLELIGDLADGRIVSRLGVAFHFKYKMFYSYFVGRRMASSPDLLKECLQHDRHLELDGLVEVLCGILPDCSDVLTNVADKLESSMVAFYEKYPLNGLDLHSNARWEITNQEDAIWKAISNRIDEGPTGTTELDELKTSLAAERRTDNQKISIIKFIVSEKSVSITSDRLRAAIESAKSAKAEVKIASIDAVIRSYALTYEVATIFAPLIAERKYVSWNGFTYINLIEDDKVGTSEEARDRMLSRVFSALPTSMAQSASERFGSRKLGQVFLALSSDSAKSSIYRFLVLSLLLRSKPSGWLDAAKEMVTSMKHDELYLRHYLSMALAQLKTEVNASHEVDQLKEFVAAIRLRRDKNVKSANKSQIQNLIKRLNENNYFAGLPPPAAPSSQ